MLQRTSSPHYLQSNGKAEKAVQTVKNLLRKAHAEKRDFHLALLNFRNTPTNDNLGSPTQRLMGHRTKTLLPTTCNLLLPKIIKPSSVKSALFKQKNTQKYYYDQKSRILPPLNTGDPVKFKSGAVWLPAVVTKVSDSPRSYVITTPKGQT